LQWKKVMNVQSDLLFDSGNLVTGPGHVSQLQ
jgi:hypothetical protein